MRNKYKSALEKGIEKGMEEVTLRMIREGAAQSSS